MTGVHFVDPRCTCAPGARCEVCRRRGIAHMRMVRLCRLWGHEAQSRPVERADQTTSLNDARAALCLAMGVDLEHIDSVTGHNLTPYRSGVAAPVQLTLDVAGAA